MSYIKNALKESIAYFEDRYPAEIEKNRKGDFAVSVQKNGKPLENYTVTYALERHDFDFGCNLFMLEQYDEKRSSRSIGREQSRKKGICAMRRTPQTTSIAARPPTGSRRFAAKTAWR